MRKRMYCMMFALAVTLGTLTANAQSPTNTYKGSTPQEANGKYVYLYNLGTNQYLGRGGKWGTEATLCEEGMKFKLERTGGDNSFTLTSYVRAEGGESGAQGMLTLMDGYNSAHDKGNFFVDQKNNNNVFTVKNGNAYGYQLTVKDDYYPTSGTNPWFSQHFYMVASGAGKKAYATSTLSTDSTAYGTWVIVTEQQRKDAFSNVDMANAPVVNATFLMADFDFARNDKSCAEWITGPTTTSTTKGSLSFEGNTQCLPADATETYYLGNGYSIKDGDTKNLETGETVENNDFQNPYGGLWTANIHGARGSVTQTISSGHMQREGWYRISCVAFTTTTKGIARLFAAAGTNGKDNSNTPTEKYAFRDLHKIDAASQPKTYVAASQLLSTQGVSTYETSLKVYVGKNGSATEPLSVGIQVGSDANHVNTDDDADATAWTCFDNFKIEYLGLPTHTLVLDEDQTDGAYIKDQGQKVPAGGSFQKSIVCLHRTMNAGKWNSLVLPVDLTVGQVKGIFGDDVCISEFEGAIDANHPQRIIFKPIGVDRTKNDAIAIQAGTLYLVKPTAGKEMPTGQPDVTFKVNGHDVTLNSYYSIVGVTFKTYDEAQKDDYNKRVEGDRGLEENGTNREVQFVGTYVKCFDTNQIPANSYVLNGNNKGGEAGLWYYRTVATKTKGFRGWLQSANGQASKGFECEINGVVDQVNGDATAIEGIEAEQQHNANIYNLNGQLVRQGATSTEGLPSGLYIVGGKKVVVK